MLVLLSNEIFHIRLRGLLVALRARAQRQAVPLEKLMPNGHDTVTEGAVRLPTRCDVLTTLQKLPEMCLTRSKETGAVIAIRRGELGYYPIETHLTPEEFNDRRGISAEQVEAMENGSVFGWEVPNADPDNVRALRAARAEANAASR